MEYFLVGKILSTHGLKGELKIRSFSDFDRFYPGSHLFIQCDNDYISVYVHSVRTFKEFFLVAFDDYLDIDLAKKFINKDILISELDREELGENAFYFSDLVTLPVFNQADEPRGIVKKIREVPQGHLLEVSYNGKICLIPFRHEFIERVDKDKIIVKEIEGLF